MPQTVPGPTAPAAARSGPCTAAPLRRRRDCAPGHRLPALRRPPREGPGTGGRRTRGPGAAGPGGRLWRGFLREIGLVTLLLVLYDVGRLLAATRVAGAYRSAADLLADERWLHLPSEQALQSLVLGLPDLTRVANAYYAYVHSR